MPNIPLSYHRCRVPAFMTIMATYLVIFMIAIIIPSSRGLISIMSTNNSDLSSPLTRLPMTKSRYDKKQIKAGRREVVSRTAFTLSAAFAGIFRQAPAYAVPPAYIIAEELGYFPVTNSVGDTKYVSARVKRESTDQAKDLATYLSRQRWTMYGAFWCPHCQRQKEMFGREAWAMVNYVECDARGVDGKAAVCFGKGVNGFPTWKKGDQTFSGEMPLENLAKKVGYKGNFDANLEPALPISGSGGSACQ
mmetsp:Transcript_22048/g.28367  ORF Transcript_22048/g.28367 Transcript_22048/m.28367 type:complete len:249 (+) Transcript_22048:58-804(+)|eukprot:CAMPEP_0116068362 /NCGR_PEP_ID=MMETSP0322-20121206/11613_1 /TAXON_ID=163516 /ORGANISM="Leptocylindrus danicus var. apora, Strain B651" /LENGTH=248 /DNA_ID=CAMNT_0003555453 /DNA_START=44 /DNA_END=793 /DNA_ORIENTATION=-